MSPIKGGGMGKLQGRATHASLDQRSLFVLALAATAFSLVLASIWSARLESAAQPEQAVNFARLVKIATCFTIAYIFRSFIPPIRQLFLGGVACFALYGALYLGTQLLPESSPEYLPLTYLAQLFSGVGDALVILLLAHLLSTYPPRVSAIAIPMAYLANEALFCLLQYAPTSLLVVARPVLDACSIALLLVCLMLNERSSGNNDGVHKMQQGLAGPSTSHEKLFRFLSSGQEWTLLLIGTTPFPFIFIRRRSPSLLENPSAPREQVSHRYGVSRCSFERACDLGCWKCA